MCVCQAILFRDMQPTIEMAVFNFYILFTCFVTKILNKKGSISLGCRKIWWWSNFAIFFYILLLTRTTVVWKNTCEMRIKIFMKQQHCTRFWIALIIIAFYSLTHIVLHFLLCKKVATEKMHKLSMPFYCTINLIVSYL